MSTRIALWREIRRAWAQWAGVGLASIASGLLLGVLLRQGVKDKLALEISLSMGFLLALLFWVLVGRMFNTEPPVYNVGVSTNVISLERVDVEGQAQSLTIAAAVILCVSVYSFQPATSLGHVPTINAAHYAIPEL